MKVTFNPFTGKFDWVLGSAAADQVAFWSSAYALSGSANFTFDGTNLVVTGKFGVNMPPSTYDFNVNGISYLKDGVNTPKLLNLTTDGFVKTSGGNGTLSVDTTVYPTGSGTATYFPYWATSTSLGSSQFYYDATNERLGFRTKYPCSLATYLGGITSAVGTGRTFNFDSSINTPFFSAGEFENLCQYTENFDNGVWSKSNVTVGTNAYVAPDGGSTAESLAQGSEGESSVTQRVTLNSTQGVFSVWLRRNSTVTYCKIKILSGVTYEERDIELSTEWQRYDVGVSFGLPAVTADVSIIWDGGTIGAWGACCGTKQYSLNYWQNTSATLNLTRYFLSRMPFYALSTATILSTLSVTSTIYETRANITTTRTDGVIIRNTTASTLGVPVQMSPSLVLYGSAYNTASRVSQLSQWAIDNLPVSGNPVSSILQFQHSLAGAAYSALFGFTSDGSLNIGAATAPTARLLLPAGTTTASTAPLKFTSGSLLSSPEDGAVEFLTDDLYLTISTGTARKSFVLTDGTLLTSGRVPFSTTNGRLTDYTGFTYASNVLKVGDGTNYTQIGSNGEITLAGTARAWQHIALDPANVIRPQSNYPGTTYVNGLGYDAFDDTTEEQLFHGWIVPNNFATGDASVRGFFAFMVDSPPTTPDPDEYVVMGFQYWKFSEGEVIDISADPDGGGALEEAIETDEDAYLYHKTLKVTCTTTGWAAGDVIIFRFFRDVDDVYTSANPDDYTGDALLFSYHLEYLTNKIGDPSS